MYILDTDTLSLLWRGQEKVAEKAGLVGGTMNLPLAISQVTYIEVMRGRFASLFTAANAAELEHVLRLHDETVERLRALTVIPFSETAVKLFDQLRVHKKLKKMGRPDMLIACITLANNATLVTRNTKDYANVPGLKLENWAD